MVYIPPGSIFDPGVVLGDAKSLETRGVYIEIDENGYPVDKGLIPGAACWIDVVNGVSYAKSYPTYDPEQVINMPFGIVLRVYARNPDKPYQLDQGENTAVVAVTGTVGLKFTSNPSYLPRMGDRVSPYGGLIGNEPTSWPSIGICDGVCTTDGGTQVVAVRINPEAGAGMFAYPRHTRCEAKSHIDENDWVYLTGEQPKASTEGVPVVARFADGGANKHIYGIARNTAEAGEPVKVLYYGVGYIPFVYARNPQLAALKAANGGKLPATFANRVVRNDGSVGAILTTILTVGSIIGMAVDITGNIYRMIKGGSSPAKCVDVVHSNSPKFRALLAAAGGKLEIEPDGYQGLFVNTNVMAPATLTEAPILLDAPERDKNGNMLIREGRVYAGSIEGVKEITAETAVAASFYGVSAPKNTEDPEVNPPTNDEEQRIRVIREGLANVVANGNWKEGDYISYLREAIPADEEEFVPHIGKALADTADGEMGVVDIRPFNPNTYIVVDCCKKYADTVTPGMSVYIDAAPGAVTDGVPSIIRQAPANDSVSGRPLSPLNPVAGVLTRFETFGDGEYDHRAVIQIAGYVKVSPRGGSGQEAFRTGTQLGSLSFNPQAQEYEAWTPTTAAGYHNILGTWITPDNTSTVTALTGWVYLNPHCVYLAPSRTEE